MWPFKRKSEVRAKSLVITTAERPTASASSPLHLRLSVEDEQHYGGGIPLPMVFLCGQPADRGWDRRIVDARYLETAIQVERKMASGEVEMWLPGRVCPDCLTQADTLRTQDTVKVS